MSVSLAKPSDFPKITAADAGTWLVGSMGWHNGYRVVQRAAAFGWTIPEEYAAGWVTFLDSWASDDGPDSDLWDDLHGDDGDFVDRATDYLESRAPQGYTFVWDAGELSLVTLADADAL